MAREDLRELISESAHCEPEYASPLAQLVHKKTAGNPFFVIHFVSSLADEGLLAFDHGVGRWSWDLNGIQAKSYTDNVVDLMVAKLNRLPGKTQDAFKQLACLGNSADFAVLRMVVEIQRMKCTVTCGEAITQPTGSFFLRNAPIDFCTTVSRRRRIP